MKQMKKLYKAFSSIKNEQEFGNFLRDLLTPREIRELIERLNIAELLFKKNLSYRDIIQKLDCSMATISRVSRFLKDEPFGGYRTILPRIHHA